MVRLNQASLGFLLPNAATGAASAVSVTPDALDIPHQSQILDTP
jgi:hypothetical protein